MKLETFVEKFDQLVDAPSAVPQMRELVLQLAVRGRLSEQKAGESSHAQLEIAEAFRIRRRRTFEVNLKDGRFSVPDNWAWVQVGAAMDMINGKAFKPEEWSLQGTPIIRIQNLNNENAPFNRCSADLDPKIHVHDGDFLISWSGTPGTSFGAFIWDRGFAFLNQHIFRCELVDGVFEKEYLRLAVNARLDEMISHAHGGVGLRHITKGNLESIALPLPPLSEQRRIVTKVEELMALCDGLAAQQKEREAYHAALSRAAFSRFNEAPTTANLNFLFHRSYSVTPADLRKAILNLAVHGKLIPQDPSDQSVDELLTVSDRQRQETAKSDRRASTDVMSLLSADDRWDVPDSWSWRALADLVLFIDYRGKTPNKVSSGIRLITAKNVRKGELNLSPDEFLSETDYRAWMTRGLPERGDVLFTTEAPMGNVAVVELAERFGLAQRVICFRSYGSLDPSFLVLQILSDSFQLILDKNATGMTAKGIKAGKLKLLPVAVPPLAEQRRIVAKVDLLMQIVDQLEDQLRGSRTFSKELLDAVVHELLHPAAEVVEFPLSESDHASQRAAIGCYAIEHLARNPSFGRTMLMKTFYLAETHLGLPLDGQHMRQAAGPWDRWLQDFESLGTRSDWFTVTEKALKNDRSKIEYSPKKALKSKAAEAVAILGTQKAEFDRLLNLFADKNTEEAEIITTLFAAWNDFLIDGKTATDDEIIYEVRENWHESKERFTPALLQRWLKWVRSHDLAPKGHGPHTQQQLTLRLK